LFEVSRISPNYTYDERAFKDKIIWIIAGMKNEAFVENLSQS
jgi:hypothetical protein